MIGIIVAMNADRVIGVNGTIPWRYPADVARFKRVTMGDPVGPCSACGRDADDWLAAGGMTCRAAMGAPHKWERYVGSTVIMGRKTWESIPLRFKPLSGRDNVVISTTRDITNEPESMPVVESWAPHTSFGCEKSIQAALDFIRGDRLRDVWFIGGARIYAEAMAYADVIDVTWVPWTLPRCTCDDFCDDPCPAHPDPDRAREVVRFSSIDESVFARSELMPHPDDPSLVLQRFERRYTLRDNEALRQKGLISR